MELSPLFVLSMINSIFQLLFPSILLSLLNSRCSFGVTIELLRRLLLCGPHQRCPWWLTSRHNSLV